MEDIMGIILQSVNAFCDHMYKLEQLDVERLRINRDYEIMNRKISITEKVALEHIEFQKMVLEKSLLATTEDLASLGASREVEDTAGKIEALAEVRGEKIISGMIGLQGTASPMQNVIFSIDGIPDWEPCSPLNILEYFKSNPVYDFSMWIMAKCKGFSREKPYVDNVGLIEFSNNTFHIAAIYNEQMKLGLLGTSSPYLHCEVKNGAPCYCGRKNCFSAYIQRGGFAPKIINEGLNKIFKEIDLSLVGLEFAEHPKTVKDLCDNGLHVKPVLVGNGYELYKNGLRMLAAENAWNSILNNVFANKK